MIVSKYSLSNLLEWDNLIDNSLNGTFILKRHYLEYHKDRLSGSKSWIESDSDNERTRKYNQLLLDSKYSLCPSGSGPNSIRFWECLAIGTIPVLLADTLELPPHELWDDTIVRIPENKLEELPAILSTINETKEKEM